MNYLFIIKYRNYFTFRTSQNRSGSTPFRDENQYKEQLGELQRVLKTDGLEVREC